MCLGYSGGLDSTVLLHILSRLRARLGFKLAALHVHHGLSPNADQWAATCAQTCARLDVPLVVRKVCVVVGGAGLESAARDARYAELAEQDADFVLVAHHADDQAETLLLRLLRGAGTHGLAAMAEERALAGAKLLRPLLTETRDELRRYALRHGLAHVEDESNADTALTRNWLRHEVLPVLESRFPSSRAVLARTAERLAESARLLDDLARMDMTQTAQAETLKLSPLLALTPARARNLLRLWLYERTGSVPSAAQLDSLIDQVGNAARDRQPAWHWAGYVVRRHRGRLSLTAEASPPSGELRWHGEPALDLAMHGRLRFVQSVGEGLAARCLPPEGAVIAWREGGERLKPDCRRPRRTLKNLLRESGLPPDARQRLPMLFVDGQLAWVAGLGFDCAFQAHEGEPGWLVSWLPPEPSTILS